MSIEEEIAEEFDGLSWGNDFTKEYRPVPIWMARQFLSAGHKEPIANLARIDGSQHLFGGFDTNIDDLLHDINNGKKSFDDLQKIYKVKPRDLILDDWRDVGKKLHKVFFREEVAKEYLIEKKWPNGVTCPWCGNDYKNYVIEDMERYKCSDCLKKFSLMAQTFFKNTKLPMISWLSAIYLMTQNRHKLISSPKLGECLKTTQKTAYWMGRKIKNNITNKDYKILNQGMFEFKSKLYKP